MPDNDYKGYLVKMMNYLDSPAEPYTKETEFSVQQLSAVTADDFMRFVNFRVYGVPEPPPNHTLAAQYRSSAVEYWKKAISSFMPNRLMMWNEISAVGNPTRCTKISDLLKKLRKLETRGQGRPSQARGSVSSGEFENIHRVMREEGDNSMKKYGFPAFVNFQNHFIARIDDTAKLFTENIKAVGDFDFVLKAKLNWSKNVREERDCPYQFMMAANDHRYDTHLSLAVWQEVDLTENAQRGLVTPYVFTFSDDVSVPDGSINSKSKLSSYLTDEVFKHELFSDIEGKRGSHSVRKFASSWARRAGISKDFRDMRARWKRDTRQGDTYDDMELPFPDAKMASVLCPGGPIKYKLRPNSNVTTEFILAYVAPKIASKYGNEVATVLGKALLWGAFAQVGDPHQRIMPNWLAERIQNSYNQHVDNDLPPHLNPVEKVPYIVTGNEGEVYLDEIPQEQEAPGAAQQNPLGGRLTTSRRLSNHHHHPSNGSSRIPIRYFSKKSSDFKAFGAKLAREKEQSEKQGQKVNFPGLRAEMKALKRVFAPSTTNAMAETAIYRQVETLASDLTKRGLTVATSKDDFQYRCSQVGLDILQKILVDSEGDDCDDMIDEGDDIDKDKSMDLDWKKKIFGDDNSSAAKEYQVEVLCKILDGLQFFVQTIPSNTLRDWPPGRDPFQTGSDLLDSLFGPRDNREKDPPGEEEDVPSEKEIAGTFMAYKPDESRVLGYDEFTPEERIGVSLDALIAELKIKLPGGKLGNLEAKRELVLKALCQVEK